MLCADYDYQYYYRSVAARTKLKQGYENHALRLIDVAYCIDAPSSLPAGACDNLGDMFVNRETS